MSFPLSLRSWPVKSKESDSLQAAIGRINEERGHFRNITEHSLQEEIERGLLADSVVESKDEVEKPQDVEARRKELYAARADMLKHVGQAQNEALTALDFISLLISKDMPRQAEISMSPFLRETIPAGTLAFDRTPVSKPNKADEELAKTVVTGWNLQSLHSAADKLLNSATRLEREMENEARYWEQVLSISDVGWSVCKMPRESHTIGVRFGFSEASPIFAARGLAALRPGSEGNIELDQGLSHQPKSVRVRLSRNGMMLGTSSSPSPLHSSQASLEELIHQARDSLFEEELYQEMIREARNLLSYGVKVIDNEIRFAARQQHLSIGVSILEPPLEVIIDQISPAVHTRGAPTSDFDQIADGIAMALRILLTNAYRHKYLVRTRTPAPLSNEKRATPVQEILRPLMCHLQHSDAMSNLQHFLANLTRNLRSAQLNASCSVDVPLSTPLSRQGTVAATVQSLIATLNSHLGNTIKLHLPDGITHAVVVTTHFSNPDYGTSFRLDLDPAIQTPNSPSTVTYNDYTELCDQLCNLMRQSIAAYIVKHNQAWTLEANGRDVRNIVHSGARSLRVSIQHERMALIGSSTAETPRVLAVWQGQGESASYKGLEAVVEDASA